MLTDPNCSLGIKSDAVQTSFSKALKFFYVNLTVIRFQYPIQILSSKSVIRIIIELCVKLLTFGFQPVPLTGITVLPATGSFI